MDSNLFSQINTTIAVKENSFITVDTFQKMLQVGNKDDIALLLQTTPYHLSVEELDDLTAIDASLMRELSQEYKWAFAEAPKKMIVNMFSLRYVYHNVKVLLKAKATGKDLSDLLIPIGEHSLEALQHMISALKSDFFPDFMVAEIRNIWAEYEDYKDIRVLEIGVDLAYFNHLQKIAEQSELPAFSQAATLMIDFYNVTTVQRVLRQKKLRSFMLQLLSDNGSFTADEFIDLVENNDLISWFNQVNPDILDTLLVAYEEKMRQGTISVVELEYLYDVMQFQLLDQARYEVQGPLVLARYLLGREFEVKNLRLLLSALCNDIPLEVVRERMRPIYGQ
ncbi:V-type ATPase subunit [Streptococcus macedonicus]|uniref:V-type ATPase subunit n=1 Tax=Streptococcus macedonicus TaxID=59310 RepID=UPI001899AD17|nr:V-type ATPase subunit [Streptococcus macedonicus]MBF6976656.1 V-type ATPase subunit [Streptococcus macedonicus]